ncbi:heme peroxidase [Ascosphaera aggregata]|nr:heme peroxidase [Ascosphaera aggregata]
MASASRNFARAFARASPARASLQSTVRFALPRELVRCASRRTYSTAPPVGKKYSSGLIWAAGAGAFGAGAWYYYSNGAVANVKSITPTKQDYQTVYDEIARLLVEKDDYDDGSYGPVLVRLAWHSSGTYDKYTRTGGSDGATIRHSPEANHGANAGLEAAREFLEPVKAKFPWISYADLYTLGGVCAVQELSGPNIPWRPGRQDADASACTPDGRLPDATQGQKHIRDIFYRMGFNDQEIVALCGAHSLGRAHPNRSGFDGPWDFSPTMFTNEFFKLLINEKWNWRKWNGPAQYTDITSQSLMMLPTDMALIQDKEFKKYVELYAKDNDKFFEDFAKAYAKLLELGIDFKQEERFVFKRSE